MEEVLGEAKKTVTFGARKVYAVLRFPLRDKKTSPFVIRKLTLSACWTVHLTN